MCVTFGSIAYFVEDADTKCKSAALPAVPPQQNTIRKIQTR